MEEEINVECPHNGILLRNEVLIHGTAWVNLENVMLCGRGQSKKATYSMVSFI